MNRRPAGTLTSGLAVLLVSASAMIAVSLTNDGAGPPRPVQGGADALVTPTPTLMPVDRWAP
jgi:hypothetical protein